MDGFLKSSMTLLKYGGPIFTLLYFGIAMALHACSSVTVKKSPKSKPRTSILYTTMGLLLLSHVTELAILWIYGNSSRSESDNFHALSSVLLWSMVLLTLYDTKINAWYPYVGSWVISFLFETAFVVSAFELRSRKIFIALKIVHSGQFLLLLFSLVIVFAFPETKVQNDAESQSLLGRHSSGNGSDGTKPMEANNYGTSEQTDIDVAEASSEEDDEDDWFSKQRKLKKELVKHLQDSGGWLNYVKRFKIFIPYMWPYKKKHLQLNIFGIGACLLVERALNVLIPRQFGIITDALVRVDRVPWTKISLYVVFRWLDSGSGILAVRNLLWLPIEQYQYQSLNTAAHAHILSLSCDFHDSKRSAELLWAINSGSCITDLLEDVSFSLLPIITDLFVAASYLSYLFDAYMTLVVFSVVVLYLWSTVKMNFIINSVRRGVLKDSRKEWDILWMTIHHWKTVSYFNRIPYETNKYASSVNAYLRSSRTWHYLSHASSFLCETIMMIGLLSACYLAAQQVVYENKSVGDFITLLSFWSQLTSPLAQLATIYRQVSSNLIQAENLFTLMTKEPSVTDAVGATPLLLDEAPAIEFENVSFAYPNEDEDDEEQNKTMHHDGAAAKSIEVLHELNFVARPGSTVALVGETGSGKSTILKLLFRFYDVGNGCIKVCGRNIRDFTIESLRGNVGFVPQDPVLFNDTIMHNIKYSRLDASDEEVYDACRAAAIHDKILTFPKRYYTKVGEDGMKLSGGEKQRLAIARAILKDPKIVILDEATSAVDTETESKIQASLSHLTKDRTTFVVAHRLSTVMQADAILVIKDGRIIEKGSHSSLLRQHGKYHDLWSKQAFIRPEDSEEDERSAIKRGKARSDSNDTVGTHFGRTSGLETKPKDESDELNAKMSEPSSHAACACKSPISGGEDAAAAARPSTGRDEQ